MKRIVIILLAGAALLACSRETEFVPDSLQERFSMTVTADDTATKTEVAPDGEGGYAVSWLAGDQLAVYEVGNGVVQEKALSTPLAAGGSTASFDFSLMGTPDGPYDYTFVYPASALGMVSAHYAVTIPQAQSFGTSSFDPLADVLVSRHVHQDVRPSSVSASFARLGGTALMTIKAPVTDETVRKIIFSTTEANLAGSYELDPATGDVADVTLEGVNSLTLTPAAATAFSGNFPVWFRLAEVNLTGSFTVSVTTDKKTYTKTLYLSSLGRNLQFQSGILTRFAVDMTGVSGVDIFHTDVINSAFTGVGTTSYTNWSGKKGSVSTAVYAGHSATRDPGAAIGLRSSQTYTGEYSGIVSTSSGGDVRAVTITAKSTSSASRTVDVYVKNTPYSSPNDLYEDSTAGDLIGSVTTPGSTETTETVNIPAGYSYVGIRSREYAVDIPEISITWEGAPVPIVSTGEATAITSAGATLSGSFTSAPGGIYEAGFYWDADASDLSALAHPAQVITTDGTAAISGSFSCPLGSLSEVTEYYYRAYVLWLNPETNTYEEYLGPVRSFTTIARDYSSALWLEMPSYTVSGMAGTTTSPLDDLYCISHSADMGGVQQRNYTYLYDPAMYTSYWVAYPLCSSHLGSGRDDQWGLFDPKMPLGKQVNLNRGYGVNKATTAYPDNYYARGHQIPNADRNGVEAMQKQTYFPTNITPQLQNGFNGGIWMDLEGAVRSAVHEGDTVYVVTGAAFRKKGGAETIEIINPSNADYGPGNTVDIPVPNYYWKVLLKVKWTGDTPTTACAVGFWLEHRDDLRINTSSYQNYVTTVDQIEQWTGFDFFANLSAALQTSCEDDADWDAFKAF